MITRSWYRWALCVWVGWAVAGCGGSTPIRPSESAAVRPSDSAPAAQTQGEAAAQPQAQPGMASADIAQAPAPMSMADSKGKSKESKGSAALAATELEPERPGLATQFGENLGRSVQTATFHRESPATPFATTTILYNDAAGSESAARSARQRSGDQAKVELFNGGLVVSLVDEHSRVLPGFFADAKLHAVGEANARYAIHIENLSDYGFEVVASVDGLSVIDGRPASIERGGYILRARDHILIEGFRTSKDTVAAFRFGKVSQSYSVEMGHGDRNVGVIGVAFFEARGHKPVYSPHDTQLRETADPFPGDYAPRPKGR